MDNGCTICYAHHIHGVHGEGTGPFLEKFLMRLNAKFTPKQRARIEEMGNITKKWKDWELKELVVRLNNENPD
jgi:hypothetical protein